MKARTLLLVPAFLILAFAGTTPRVPTVEDLVGFPSQGGAVISPDGHWVAYTVTRADMKLDAFVTHVWLVPAEGGEPRQMTRGDKSAGGIRWSPDGKWLAFTSNRVGDKSQIFAMRPDGGEALQLTNAEGGVIGFAWSRDGKQIAFTSTDSEPQSLKDRKDYMGDFEVVRREYRHTHIWTFDVAAALEAPAAGTRRTRGTDYSVSSLAWSPDGSRIAFSATANPDLIQGETADIYLLSLSDDKVRKLVAQPGPDTNPQWSPDGKQVLFSSVMGKRPFFARNSRLALVPVEGGTPRSISDSFDENPSFVEWNSQGIYFGGLQKMSVHLFLLDPATGAFRRLSRPDDLIASGYSLTPDGRRIALAAGSPTSVPEVFVCEAGDFTPRRLTNLSGAAAGFKLGTREAISWKSRDGTPIEGVLIKPADFDPARKYPLLCIIHGGPTGIDMPVLLSPDARYYPADIWAGRGALILKVNYRGSTGYGEQFRQLNVRNLGVGDAWDVLSGVDHLISKGWVDPAKVGCMGWSQGGYISAFLTTSSDRFAAISVGAGISNWATYYYNTDITPFTINYLGDDPADDPEIYRKTSPMTYIRQARTPTLIQHGELDRRVPIPNAYELRQGLEDRAVKVEMVVYKGFPHGITKPKAMRAVMWHNMVWFNHYLWGDPLPDLSTPELPAKPSAEGSQKQK